MPEKVRVNFEPLRFLFSQVDGAKLGRLVFSQPMTTQEIIDTVLVAFRLHHLIVVFLAVERV